MQTPSHLGIENLKAFLVRLIKASDLDKNRDGKVSRLEQFQAIAGLLPSLLFNGKDSIAEARDLDKNEIVELFATVSEYLPDYPGLDNRKEDVIKAALNLVVGVALASDELFVAIKKLKEPVVETPEISDDFVESAGKEAVATTTTKVAKAKK